MMKLVISSAVAALAVAGTVSAASPRAEVMAPVNAFNDAFAKGDMKAAAATYAPDVSIVDEVPPYAWRGPNAFTTWLGDLQANDKKLSLTEEKLALGAPIRTESDGRHAYVVTPAVFTFTQSGKAMRENARMTFALRKGADGWKIAGWTFTSARAVPVLAPKAAPPVTGPVKP